MQESGIAETMTEASQAASETTWLSQTSTVESVLMKWRGVPPDEVRSEYYPPLNKRGGP
jgi:hypothetical protein